MKRYLNYSDGWLSVDTHRISQEESDLETILFCAVYKPQEILTITLHDGSVFGLRDEIEDVTWRVEHGFDMSFDRSYNWFVKELKRLEYLEVNHKPRVLH